jgi:hypothetical protein
LQEGGFKDASVAVLLCLSSGHSMHECSVCATMTRFHYTLKTLPSPSFHSYISVKQEIYQPAPPPKSAPFVYAVDYTPLPLLLHPTNSLLHHLPNPSLSATMNNRAKPASQLFPTQAPRPPPPACPQGAFAVRFRPLQPAFPPPPPKKTPLTPHHHIPTPMPSALPPTPPTTPSTSQSKSSILNFPSL